MRQKKKISFDNFSFVNRFANQGIHHIPDTRKPTKNNLLQLKTNHEFKKTIHRCLLTTNNHW